MKITSLRFKEGADDDSLQEDFKQDLTVLAENLAICMAEMRKWEAFKNVAAEALLEGMSLLQLEQINADGYFFKMTRNGLTVEFERGVIH